MSYDNPNMAIIAAIRRQGMTVTEASHHFKRSRQWIYTLLHRFDTGGPDAVQPQSKAPKTSPNCIPDELVDHIVRIRRDLTSRGADNGPDSIARVLNQQGLRVPAESTIRRILTAKGLITPHQAYNALPKATPQPLVTEDNRVRYDKVDTAGRITLRFAGRMRYLYIGRAHAGTPTLTVVVGTHAMTSDQHTGEVIAEHDIDTNRQYQPNLLGTQNNG